MIVKKIPNANSRSTKAARIGKLIAYIRDPVNRGGVEKCIYARARGFLAQHSEEQVQEMCALAADAVRSKDPINHYVLSWREGEQPTPDHVEEAVTIFLGELGLAEHQAVYGLHADTDNIHLHICVNRVIPWHLRTDSLYLDCQSSSCISLSPKGGRRVVAEINKGFDLEAVHMAVARIVHAQGWMSEQNARFSVVADGELCRTERRNHCRIAVGTRKADMEVRTGEKSAERVAKEIAAPLIMNARSWVEMHSKLAAEGIRYEKSGSGATVFVGDIPVKASVVDRKASLAQLVKRFGPFSAAPSTNELVVREPEPLQKGVPDWDEYTISRKKHYVEKRAAAVFIQQQHSKEYELLAAEYRARRTKTFAGNWKGKGCQLNALRSALAAEHAVSVVRLKERQKKERIAMRRQFGRYPDLEQWLRDRHGPVAADQWRHRSGVVLFEIEGIGDADVLISPGDIRNFTCHIQLRGEVHYCRAVGSWPAFVDYGRHVSVFEFESEDAVLAALQLASAKWPRGIMVSGNDAFKQLCAKLAESHGIVLLNPEFQLLVVAKQSLAVQRSSAANDSIGLEM